MAHRDMIKNAKNAARHFASGSGSMRARAWHHVTNHDDIVDGVVMDEVRAAHCADSEYRFSPEDLIEFRNTFITEILKKGYVM